MQSVHSTNAQSTAMIWLLDETRFPVPLPMDSDRTSPQQPPSTQVTPGQNDPSETAAVTISTPPLPPLAAATPPERSTPVIPPSSASATHEMTASLFKGGAPHNIPERVGYFGDYEILGEIARGGMGVVYRARQMSLNRPVALKMILAGDLAGEQEISRFHSEAESAANLVHSSIVPIFEIGKQGEQYFFSMGLIDGGSLSDRLRNGPLTDRQAAELMIKIADGVHFAHTKGVVHRDLKPGNVLIDHVGNPHITDFGLAKQLHSSQELTTTGQVLGTPAYMPPEQAKGDLKAIGPASDIYSLGAMLYAMVAGRPPHAAGSVVETLRQVIEVEPPSVRTLNPSVARDIETICSRCLAKNPSERFASANELVQELQRFLKGEPILSRPVSALERTWRWAKRNPRLTSLTVAVVLLALVLAIGGPIVAWNQSKLRESAESNEQKAIESAHKATEAKAAETQALHDEQLARRDAEKATDDLRIEKERSDLALYARTIALAAKQWDEGNIQVAQDLLLSVPESGRDFEWDHINALCRQHLVALTELRSIPRFVGFVYGANRLIAAGTDNAFGNDPRTYISPLEDGNAVETRNALSLATTRDGKRLAVSSPESPDRIQIVDTLSGQVITVIEGHRGGTVYAAFGGSDDDQVITVGRDKTIRVWNATHGKLLATIETPNRKLLFPASLSPDGNQIAFRRADDGVLEVLQQQSTANQSASPSAKQAVSEFSTIYSGSMHALLQGTQLPVVYSPDGRLFAAGAHGEVEVYSTSPVELLMRFSGPRGSVRGLAFSPDSQRLAVASNEPQVRIYDMIRRSQLSTIAGHGIGITYGINSVAFDETGNRLATGGSDTVVKVWDAWSSDRVDAVDAPNPVAPSQSFDFLPPCESYIEQVRFSPDERTYVVASADGSVRLFDVESKQLRRQWVGLKQPIATADISDQRALVVAGEGGINSRSPGVVVAWNSQTGEELWRFSDLRGPVRRLSLTADATRVVATVGSLAVTTGEVVVLDAESGKLIWRNEKSVSGITDLAIAPDDRWFATAGGAGIHIWQMADGSSREIADGKSFRAVAISRDGKSIAGGTIDWLVGVYDSTTGSEKWSQRSHSGAVSAITWTADDRRVLSTSLDGTARVFDSVHGDLFLTLTDTGDQLLSVTSTRDGSRFATAGLDLRVRVRNAPFSGMASIRRGTNSIEGQAKRSHQWIELYSDDFNRSELGPNWNGYHGTWKVESGSVRATLAPSTFAPGTFDAILISSTLVPRECEIQCDITVGELLALQLKLSDKAQNNAIGGMVLAKAIPQLNLGEKGGVIFRLSGGNYRQEASRRDSNLEIAPGKPHHLAIRRSGTRLQLTVDNEQYVAADIDADLPTPWVSLIALLGTSPSEITIDNWRVLIPAEARLEAQALPILQELENRIKLKPLVLAEISKRDASDHDAKLLKLELTRLAENLPVNPKELVGQIAQAAATEKLLSGESLSAEQFQLLHDWIIKEVRTKTLDDWRAAAQAAFRANDLHAADLALTEADNLHRLRAGCSHPIDVALRMICRKESSDSLAVLSERELLQELMRARHWKNDERVQYWVDLARQVTGETKSPPASPQAGDNSSWTERLKQFAWELQSEITLDNQPDKLLSVMADDAQRLIARNVGDTSPLSISRQEWIAHEELNAKSGTAFDIRLTRVACRVVGDESTPQVESRFVLELPAGHLEWNQTDEFHSPNTNTTNNSGLVAWKLIRETVAPIRLSMQGTEYRFDETGLKRLDEQVERARSGDNQAPLIHALVVARRHMEALPIAQQLADENPTIETLVRLASIAHDAHQGDIALSAARKAIQLDPKVGGPPFMRGLAAIELMSATPKNLGPALSVKVPSFYRAGQIGLLGVGNNGLAAWQPTMDSLVGFFVIPHENPAKPIPVNEFGQRIAAARIQAFNAELLQKRDVIIAGTPSYEIVQRAGGIGRAFAGGVSNANTIQRFVFVPRKEGFLALLLSAYQTEFQDRDAEFQQVIKTIQFP